MTLDIIGINTQPWSLFSAFGLLKPIMAETMSAEEKIALITENLQEVLKPDIIEDVILRQKRPLIIYWGIL